MVLYRDTTQTHGECPGRVRSLRIVDAARIVMFGVWPQAQTYKQHSGGQQQGEKLMKTPTHPTIMTKAGPVRIMQ